MRGFISFASSTFILFASISIHSECLGEQEKLTYPVKASHSVKSPLKTGLMLSAGQIVLIEPNPNDTWGSKPPVNYLGRDSTTRPLQLWWGIGTPKTRVTEDHQKITIPSDGELTFACRSTLDQSGIKGTIRVSVTVLNGAEPTLPIGTNTTKTSKRAVATTSKTIDKSPPTPGPVQSSIHGLVVQVMSDGSMYGKAMEIIATRNINGRGDAAHFTRSNNYMTKSLDDAYRIVQTRHPDWHSGPVDIDFSDKITPKDGESACTAFTVAICSLADDFKIDPNVALTGDMSLNGKVQMVGGVAAKIRGGVVDKATIIGIPESNADAVLDMALLYDRKTVWSAQIFSMTTLEEAIDLARVDRPENLAKALKLFAELQPNLLVNESSALNDPQLAQKLSEILTLAPRHLSAQYLLSIIQKKAPRQLSRGGSLSEVFKTMYPMTQSFSKGTAPKRETLPSVTVQKSIKRLQELEPITHPDVQPILKSIRSFIYACDQVAGFQNPPPPEIKAMQEKAAAVTAAIQKLLGDPKAYEKLMREGT